MAKNFVRKIEKWYVSLRTYSIILSSVAAISYPIFGIEFTKSQQDNMAKYLYVVIPVVLSLGSAGFSYASKRKQKKNSQKRRASDTDESLKVIVQL